MLKGVTDKKVATDCGWIAKKAGSESNKNTIRRKMLKGVTDKKVATGCGKG